MGPKILMAVSPSLQERLFDKDALARLESFARVTYYQGPGDMEQEELSEIIAEHRGLITSWGSPKVTRHVLEKAEILEIISHAAGSVRSYIEPEVFNRGICVTNASSAIAVSVAEFTVGLVLSSLKYLCRYNSFVQAGGEGRPEFGDMHELTGRTVGIIGMGEVGRRVVDLLRGFSCRVLVYDPYKPGDEIRKSGAFPCSLEELMSGSRVVSLHAPNIPANRGMITEELLARMPDGAIFVNTARSQLVDEDALAREVNSGRIRCALDTYDLEPEDLGKNGKNSIMTPHIAGQTREARWRQGRTVVEDLDLFLRGRKPNNEVTKSMMEWVA